MLKILHIYFVASVIAGIAGVARASDDAESEGRFNNKSAIPLYCYKDIYAGGQWAICSFRLAPGATCRGDAIAAQPRGPVFKIPNHTEFNCSATATGVDCQAANRMSSVLIRVAGLIHKKNGYEAMSWDAFYTLMTGGQTPPIKECDQSWVPLPAAACAG